MTLRQVSVLLWVRVDQHDSSVKGWSFRQLSSDNLNLFSVQVQIVKGNLHNIMFKFCILMLIVIPPFPLFSNLINVYFEINI